MLDDAQHEQPETQLENYLMKYTNHIEALTEIADTIRNNCSGNCYRELKNILQKYGILSNSHRLGGRQLAKTDVKVGVSNGILSS